jgi:hypothetical protein
VTTRLVLLGASNVRRGLPVVVGTARAALGPDLEIFGAFGHGRSYGERSCFLFRCLPGILESGLWEALEGSSPAKETAVVTDVGNDIQYGADAAAILGWVRECVARLAARGASIRITAIPLARLARVTKGEYLFFRTIFFPRSRVARNETLETAAEVDSQLRRLAAETGATIVEPRGEWYGGDPIHIRRAKRRSAWAEILGVPAVGRLMSGLQAIRLRAAAPDWRWVGGIELRASQPTIRIGGETPVSLY